jgi:VCBS repeat-containing protein
MLASQASVSGNLLANDSDIDAGTQLAVTAGSFAGKYGNLVLNSDGSYVYQLDASASIKALGRGASVVEHFDYTGGDGFAALLSSLDITIAGTNDAPVLAKALADIHVGFNKAFWFQLPAGSFVDVDKGDTLVYSATLADGSALPSWLKFDGATGTFSGTAPKQVTSIDVRLSATDKATGASGDLSASDVFKLYINHGNNGSGNGVDAAPNGQQTDKDSPPVDNPWVLQGSQNGGGKLVMPAAIVLDYGYQPGTGDGGQAQLVGVPGMHGIDLLMG